MFDVMASIDELCSRFSLELKLLVGYLHGYFYYFQDLWRYEPLLTQVEKERLYQYAQGKSSEPGIRTSRVIPPDIGEQFKERCRRRDPSGGVASIQSLLAAFEDWVTKSHSAIRVMGGKRTPDFSYVRSHRTCVLSSLNTLLEVGRQVETEAASPARPKSENRPQSVEQLRREKQTLRAKIAEKDAELEELLAHVRKIQFSLPRILPRTEIPD
eukprot:Rmarinus@m.21085